MCLLREIQAAQQADLQRESSMETEEVMYTDFVTLTILLQQYQLEAARLYLVRPNRYQRDCNNPAYVHGIIRFIHIGIADGMVILCKEGLQIYGMRKDEQAIMA